MKIINSKKLIKSPFVKGDVRRTGGLNGFSFIELIVVITIIAVISVVGAVSYGTVSKKTRDGRRISDIQNMRMALEAVRQVGVTYPATGSFTAVMVPNYLPVAPVGPKGDAYTYTRLTNYTYEILTTMEDLGSTTGDYTGTNNYRVTNP